MPYVKRGKPPNKEPPVQSLKSASQTPQSVARPKPSSVKTWSIVIASMTLASCATSMQPSQDARPSPLIVASCPKLTELSDPSFGATVLKLMEVAGQYAECREAALAGQPVPKADYNLTPKR